MKVNLRNYQTSTVTYSLKEVIDPQQSIAKHLKKLIGQKTSKLLESQAKDPMVKYIQLKMFKLANCMP